MYFSLWIAAIFCVREGRRDRHAAQRRERQRAHAAVGADLVAPTAAVDVADVDAAPVLRDPHDLAGST